MQRELVRYAGDRLRISAYVAAHARARCPEVDPTARRYVDCTLALRGRTGLPVRVPVRWDTRASRPVAPPGVVDLEHVIDVAFTTPGLKDALIERCSGAPVRAARIGERIACTARRGAGAAKPLILRVTDGAGHVAVVR